MTDPQAARETPRKASDKQMHTHIYVGTGDGEDYRHDHRLLTLSQLRLHLDMQHQPRRLPLVRYDGRRGVLDLDAGKAIYDER